MSRLCAVRPLHMAATITPNPGSCVPALGVNYHICVCACRAHPQSARAAALAAEAGEAELRGALIEYNLEAVDAAITALNTSLATGG